MGKPGNSLLDQIGHTPLIEVFSKNEVKIFAKAEWFNPGGSVKDRPAYKMIQTGIASGKLTKEKTLLDYSSGNTGIAYAMIGAALGYRIEMVIPENASQERRKILAAFGAKLHLTDAQEGFDGAIREARRLAEAQPEKYFMPDQYNNEANAEAHYETTGVEIWEQTAGRVTHFLASVGTSGTVMGTSKRLKEYNPSVKCYAVEPDDPFHGLEGMQHTESAIKPGIYDPNRLDGVFTANTEKAYELVRQLAKQQGLFAGPSSGAVFSSALELAEQLDQGVIVVVFPDGGNKYLTTKVWE